MSINPELLEIAEKEIRNLKSTKQLAEILTAIQEKLGYIPPATVPLIAERAEITRAEIYRVIELSPNYSLTPAGDHKLFICNAENCCMQGGVELMEYAQQYLGIKEFETTADNKVRLESFQCLGNCSMAPNVMLNGRVYGMMDPRQLQKLLEDL